MKLEDKYEDGIEGFVMRHPVVPNSSDLLTVGWGPFGGPHECHLIADIPCGVLDVQFKSGSVYRYYHVPEDVAALMQGRRGQPLTSVGAYFHQAIRRPAAKADSGIDYRLLGVQEVPE